MGKQAILTYTGNPFVDAGISAILAWTDKRVPEEICCEDIKSLIPKIIRFYVSDGWRKLLFSVFPNNPVTNPSIKDKSVKLEEYYSSLIDSIKPLGEKGTCIACGLRDADRSLTKTEVPLTGSGSLKNFFSYALGGANYCSTCALAIQFSPLVYYSCRRIILLHSNSQKIMRRWARECKKEISLNGCFNEGYTNPRNSLFHIAEKLTAESEEQWNNERVLLRIYYFTNYNRGPELDIYDLPEIIFNFIHLVRRRGLYYEWRKIVRRGYRVKKNVDITDENETEYKNHTNDIYLKMLQGTSITSYFIDPSQKAVCCSWKIVDLYLLEVKKMDKDRISLIKRIGDEIADVIHETDKIQRISDIERTYNYNEFLRMLLLIIKSRIALRKETPLFTFEEFSETLFPEGWKDWKEVKLIILFRIYEKLHDWIVSQKSPEEIEKDIDEIVRMKEDE